MKSKIASVILGAVALAMAIVSLVLTNLGEITVILLGVFLGVGLLVLAVDMLFRAQGKSG
jgi:hypothetical protein